MFAPWSLTARWILPVDQAPIPDGCVTIRDATIVAVEPAGCRRADIDLGDAAVLPGFVNAHTHLDLTDLRGRLPPSSDIVAWLQGVIQFRRAQTPELVRAAIEQGIRESLTAGTTLVGDIASIGLSWDALSQSPLRAVVFYELLGLSKDRVRASWRDAVTWLQTHPPTVTCRPGLSPHAPYSVRAALYGLAIRYARVEQLPLMTHLAEFPAEVELLQNRAGPLVSFLEGLGVWHPDGLARSVEQVLHWHRSAPHALFAHGNYLPDTATLAPGGTIVYCPRTHAAFGHRPHPFRELLEAGVRVALGTDSLASNPDLSLLNEVRYLHAHHPEVPGATLLRLATLNGAAALGWDQETGSLTPGKSADLVVIPLDGVGAADPYQLILRSTARVTQTMCRGQWFCP